MAATHCATLLADSGDHILAGTDIYGGTYRLLHKVCNHAGVSVALVSTSGDLAAVERAITPRTRLLWIESPGNPLLSITDVAACAELAHRHGVLLAVDNTFATPALTRPLELGADIVMHSATKYIGGHSDLLGGALVVRDQKLFERLYFIQNATGAVMGPLESYLASRGLKTLELRIREQSRTAARVAEWLAADRRVNRVFYPGLVDHPGHEIARRQMDGSIRRDVELRGGRRLRRGQARGRSDAAVSAWRSAWGPSSRLSSSPPPCRTPATAAKIARPTASVTAWCGCRSASKHSRICATTSTRHSARQVDSPRASGAASGSLDRCATCYLAAIVRASGRRMPSAT